MGTGELIREADHKDIPALVRMAGDFLAASGTGLPFDPDYVAGALRQHLATPARLTLVLDVDGPRGMLCAAAQRSPLAPVAIAEEIVFWIDPAHRGRSALAMLKDYAAWAKETGCERATMIGLASMKSVDRLYRLAGFEPLENTYARSL